MRQYHILLILLAFLCQPLFSQQPQIDYSNGNFSVKNEPVLTPHAKASKTPYWKYFWEFGDGHFSTEKSPRHLYQNQNNYAVRLHMTPYYAVGKSRVVAGQVTNVKTGNPAPDDFRGNIVMLSSANNGKNDADIVPGNSYEFVVQVKATTDMAQNGHLFVFYNKIGEVGTVPFNNIFDLRPYLKGKNVVNAKPLITASAPQTLKSNANKFRDVFGFEVYKMRQGEQRNFFFSIKANQALDRFQDKNIKLKIVACWVPEGVTSSGTVESVEYNMEVLAVHDPNKLTADKTTQYFKKNFPSKIDYTLQFQNEEAGIVNKVRAVVTMDKGINISSVKVTGTDMENYPLCNGNTNRPCYEVLLPPSPEADSFTLIFHELGLEGKDSKKLFESKKSTKAKIHFSVYGSTEREATSKARAAIHFDNVDEVITPKEKINWRMKSMHIRGGINEKIDANTYTAGSSEGSNDISWSFGVGFQNAPLGRGFARTLDIGVSSFNLHKESLQNLGFDFQDEPIDFLYTFESIDLKVFDLRYGLGYQPARFLKVYAAAGIAMPVWGTVQLDGWFDPVYSEGIEPTVQDADILDFAIWRQDEEGDFMGQQIKAPSKLPGLSTQVGVEFGLLNDINIGAGYEIRRLNKSYNGKCLTIANLTLYAKLRLFRL